MFSMTDKYFDFLFDDGFKGPYEYNDGHEMQSDCVKRDLVIKISYDGRFWAFVIKTKKVFPELECGTKKLKDFDRDLMSSYNLEYLDPQKKLLNSLDFNNKEDKYLWYYSKLLKDNPEILRGDF